MNIPFVDLKRQYQSIRNELDSAIQDVIKETAFIGGKYVATFEREFANAIGTKFCIGVGNGTDALFIALRALKIGQGDEVITAANTFIATTEAITMTGARVCFVDCDEKTYNINVHLIEQAITEKTRAIIPVHLYGQPADMDVVLALANKYNLFVVEDAAQAHFASYKGKKVGTLGNAACFSFYPGKNLGAYGDAGAVLTNDEELALRIRMIANHGRISKFDHEFEGVNSRIDGLQAAILTVKLRHLENWTLHRITMAKYYDKELSEALPTPRLLQNVRHVYHLYVIQVNDRERIRKELRLNGISTGVHYPTPLPFLKAYDYMGHKPIEFPITWSQKDKILSLPMHDKITEEEVMYVSRKLKQLIR